MSVNCNFVILTQSAKLSYCLYGNVKYICLNSVSVVVFIKKYIESKPASLSANAKMTNLQAALQTKLWALSELNLFIKDSLKTSPQVFQPLMLFKITTWFGSQHKYVKLADLVSMTKLWD